MMQLLATELRDAIRDLMITGWSLDKVHYGAPQLEQTSLPYGVIRLDSVPIAGNVEQTYLFQLFYVGAWTAGDVLEDVKVQRANELLAVLLATPILATYGSDPQVAGVSFEESDDPNEPTYVVQVDFAVTAHWCGG